MIRINMTLLLITVSISLRRRYQQKEESVNINEIVAMMPKAPNPYDKEIEASDLDGRLPDELTTWEENKIKKLRAYSEICDTTAKVQCRLLAEQGWTPPIEPIPEHCPSHKTFQDNCQGCQGITGQIKCYDGKYHDIDWASFNLGQEIMLDQGYQKGGF